MEKKKYKVLLFDQDFYFVSDDPEEIVLASVRDLQDGIYKTFQSLNDNSGSAKIQVLLLNLVQAQIEVNLLRNELDEYRKREDKLSVFVDSVAYTLQN